MWTLRAQGAPTDQGLLQGRAAQTELRRACAEARRRAGWFNWSRECRRAARANLRPTAWYLPQLSEREHGIALGAAIRPGALACIARAERIRARGHCAAGSLGASLEDPALTDRLIFRVSDPDQVGLPSLELTSPGWAGCLGGINGEGVAVIVLEETGGPGPRAALYAQDLLFRTSNLASAVTQLRTRASYAGGSGTLLLADADGSACSLTLVQGALSVRKLPSLERMPANVQFVIDLAARELRFRGERARL